MSSMVSAESEGTVREERDMREWRIMSPKGEAGEVCRGQTTLALWDFISTYGSSTLKILNSGKSLL